MPTADSRTDLLCKHRFGFLPFWLVGPEELEPLWAAKTIGYLLSTTTECNNCSREVKATWDTCPYCGEEIDGPTPWEARQLSAVLTTMQAKMNSSVDQSWDGLVAAMRYADAAGELVSKFTQVFKVFLDFHEHVRNDPSLLSNSEWVLDARVRLAVVNIASMGETDPKKPLLLIEDFLPIPDGCFGVHFELMKLHQHADELMKHYDAFLKAHNPVQLEASGEAVRLLDLRVHAALDKLEKLSNEIDQGQTRHAQ